jgi:hypothetical protein
MSQFYAQAVDKERCLWSSIYRAPVTITGLNTEGKIRAFTGMVQSVEKGHTRYPGYPLLVTMPNSN